MNSARARGLHRIRQATVALGSLGLVVTGGSMALAHDDVQAASQGSSGTTSSTGTTNSGSSSTTDDSSSTWLGSGSGGASAQSAGS